MRSLLKLFISQGNRAKIRALIENFDKKLVPFFAKNKVLSSLYYCFFSSEFRREHQSVLRGRMNYWKRLEQPDQASAMLRRNIHRVEKGLIMRPRRDVFGLAFIQPTVERYISCVSSEQLEANEEKWATDVLSQYFDAVAVGINPLVDELREQFNGFVEGVEVRESSSDTQPFNGNYSPYQRLVNTPSNIEFEQFVGLCKQRRSVRWFQDKPVPNELIENAVSAATLAPSACNRQPFEFHVVNNPKLAQEIGAIPMGTAGFSHNFQSLIVVVGDLSCYPYERDRHVIYIDGSLASMQLMLSLETLGLSSCVINWPDIEQYEKRMSKRLGLEKNERPIMVIALGYADPQGMIPFSQKKTAKQLIKEVVA
ncbi:Nitroreductase [Vibrio jasicida]|nr:Nitroreductase [Vibrio jasicida]CAH1607967.1 Nitroreductase [Vibrio jasicida]